MKVARARSVVVSFSLAAALVACGEADSSREAAFGAGGDEANTADNTTAGATNGDANGNASANDGSNAPNQLADLDPAVKAAQDAAAAAEAAANAKCATVNVKAQQLPVYLVVMYDRSASMLEDQKWTSCSKGLKAFFADAKSSQINASMGFFPRGATDKTTDVGCQVATYDQPEVAMTALPNTTTFAAAIDTVGTATGTPTKPALQGALVYAKKIRDGVAAKNKGKVAVVLVTDGEPIRCGSTVATVAAEAASGKATLGIPTYVIGVGKVSALDQVAAAGGGRSTAFIVDTKDPAQTATQFQDALATIRGAQLACEYAVPAAPEGKTLDLAAVNVRYTSSAAVSETLSYDKDCTGSGWRYDDPSAPSKITLCPTTCAAVKSDASPKVDVEMGCATKGTDGQIPR